jgi:hypothetical protein
LALNTGDNVYIAGGDSNYRDFWFPDWNSDVDSNERGAPFIRNHNHDVGSTGATANLLADGGATTPGFSGPEPFGSGLSGGDALAYFNNYYFPLNGPSELDIQQRFVRDNSTLSNFLFQYPGFNGGNPYSSPVSVEALPASTTVNTGVAAKRQIDHMSNYSFDYVFILSSWTPIHICSTTFCLATRPSKARPRFRSLRIHPSCATG